MHFLWDGLTLAAYFGLVLGVGLRSARGVGKVSREGKDLRDYSLGSQTIPWGAVLASIIAAELTAATFLGTPGEGYALRNFTYAQLAFGTILARIIVAYLFIPVFYSNRVVSIYEFLEIRFGPVTKRVASGVFLVTRLLASGARLYVAAVVVVLAFELVQGAAASNETKLMLYAGAIVSVTLLTSIYTVAGGIRAVVWTDVIQAAVMGGAVLYALGALWVGVGGWSGLRPVLTHPHDLQFFDDGFLHRSASDAPLSLIAWIWSNIRNILGSEYTIWAALLGSTFVTMATHGTDQDMVQRMLTARNPSRSRLALVLSGIVDLPVNLAFLGIGILLAVYYQLHPDPHLPSRNPEVFAYYIIHQLPPGARGLLVAGVLATAMGSLSTALNALATSFTQDFWRPFFAPAHSARNEELRAARWSTVVFAVLLAAVAITTADLVINSPQARIIPLVLGIFGYTYGSLLGIFLLGLLTRTRGNEKGNLIAMAGGFLVVAVLSGLPWDILNAFRGQSSSISVTMMELIHSGYATFSKGYIVPPKWLVQIEFPWRILFGSVTTFLVALLFSTPSPKRHRQLSMPK